MGNSAPGAVLLALSDAEERGALSEALQQVGLSVSPAPHASLDKAGGALAAAIQSEKADFLVADKERWIAVRNLLPPPPRPYLVVLLLGPSEEADAPALLEDGVFDYLRLGGAGWIAEAASYFRVLAVLRRRFAGAIGALERRYEDLVHALPDIVYELDADGRFTFINNSVHLLGYDPADLLGKHFSVLLHEEDAAVVDRASVLELFRGAHTGPALSPKLFNERRSVDRRTENLEVRLRRKPGTPSGEDDLIVTVLSYGEVTAAGEYSQRDGSQSFLGSVGVIRDITLRRKSEEMLRKLYQAVDQLSAGVMVADRAFRIEYVNPTFFRISGLSPQEVIGTDLLSFFDFGRDQAEELRSLVRDGFDARYEVRLASVAAGEARGRPDGTWTAVHASPVRSPAGAVTHAIVICEDISQRRAMEELVSLAKEEAERANRAKSDFLASMGHELKSPVASILAAARLIEMGGPESERRASAIISNAQGLLDMLGDILDFVRFETGAGLVRKYSFPLSGFVARTCEPYRLAALEKGLGFEVGPIPDETLRSDPDRLGRAFAALLGNAVSFTERGRVRVDAAIERRAGNVPHLVLSVSDTGVGIAPEDQGRIFAPFVQLASPYNKKGGAGIGLSLARNIVRALGGEIRLQSESGRGSVFTVLVPVGEPEIPSTTLLLERRIYRLLVVDDNEVNLEYMATILSNAGHRIDTASSGAEALKVLEGRPPDAAILDIQMPGMSGIELGRKIRAYVGNRFDPSLPLVALTAFDPEEVARSGVDFDAVFSKPMDVSKLLASLDESVDRREASDPAAFRAHWAGRRTEGRSVLARAEAEVPRLLEKINAAAEAGEAESLRVAARALEIHFEHLGADRVESALRRLVLSLPDEDRFVARCRVLRLSAGWKRLREDLAAGLLGPEPGESSGP